MSVTLVRHGGTAVHVKNSPTNIPLFSEAVSAGFPSPAEDYIEQSLDLNEFCIKRPAATFFVRVQGDSMIDAGIYNDDMLVIDRSIPAAHGDIVIAGLHGEFTVKELQLRPRTCLVPKNKAYSPIDIPEGSELDIFGVVTHVIRNLRQK